LNFIEPAKPKATQSAPSFNDIIEEKVRLKFLFTYRFSISFNLVKNFNLWK